MSDVIGRADYELSATLDKLKAAVAEADKLLKDEGSKTEKAAEDQASRTTAKIGAITRAGVTAVTTGASLLFAAAAKGALEMQSATAKYRAEAGLSEEAAKKAAEAANRLSAAHLQDFDKIVDTQLAVIKNLGLEGDAAERATDKILDYATATGRDAVDATANFDDILDSWGRTAAELPGIMDLIVASTQKWGGTVQEAEQFLADNAAALQAANLTMEQGIGLLDLYRASGLDAGAAQRALNTAVKDLPPGQNLETVLQRISAIVDPTERAQAAMEIFGTKAGTGLANALKPGFKGLADFEVSMADAQGATERAADAIESTLPNQIKLALSKAMEAVRGFGADFGPALMAAASLASFGGSIASALKLDVALKGALTSLQTSPVVTGAAESLGRVTGGLAGKAFGISFAAAAVAGITLFAIEGAGRDPDTWSGQIVEGIANAGDPIADAFDQMLGTTSSRLDIILVNAVEKWRDIHHGEIAEFAKSVGMDWQQLRDKLILEVEKTGGDVDLAWQNLKSSMFVGPIFDPAALAAAGAEVPEGIADGISDADAVAKVRANVQNVIDVVTAQRDWAIAQQKARDEARDAALHVRDGLLSGRSAVQEGMANLKWAMLHPLRGAKEEAWLEGMLASKRLARGLASEDPTIRAAAVAEKETIEQELARLKGYQLGVTAGTDYASGVSSTQTAAGRAAAAVAAAVWRNLHLSSPAKEGPLSEDGGPEGWGVKLGTLMAKGVARTHGEMARAAAGLGSLALGSFGDRAGMLGLSASSDNTVRHEHSGTVQVALSPSTVAAMRDAGYSGTDVGLAARAASGISELLETASRMSHLRSTAPRSV